MVFVGSDLMLDGRDCLAWKDYSWTAIRAAE